MRAHWSRFETPKRINLVSYSNLSSVLTGLIKAENNVAEGEWNEGTRRTRRKYW